MDRVSSDYIDNANLILTGDMYNTCRYFLEVRIWNRALTEAEVKAYSNKLKLTEADPLYKNLIGYWQFYKDKNGEEKYLKDDSLVVNQIKTVMNRLKRLLQSLFVSANQAYKMAKLTILILTRKT